MDKIDLRQKLLDNINTADERLLHIINAVFESYQESKTEEDIVAFTVGGEPLTSEQFIKKIKEADAAIDRGEYISHEDMKKEVLTWGR